MQLLFSAAFLPRACGPEPCGCRRFVQRLASETQDGQTPLHLAAENDHSNAVKMFLGHRSDLVTKANKNGETCAHIAASKGSVAVINELINSNRESVITATNTVSDVAVIADAFPAIDSMFSLL